MTQYIPASRVVALYDKDYTTPVIFWRIEGDDIEGMIIGNEDKLILASDREGFFMYQTESEYIPCTVRVNAVFTDNTTMPVICWRVRGSVLEGMILEESMNSLSCVSEFDEFSNYEYVE